MTQGFASPERLQRLKNELVTWSLYQVAIDKYHVMFWFENGHCLLNVAYRFSFRSSDGSLEYVYDVQAPGDRKLLGVDSILRRSIKAVEALDDRRLALVFDGGDTLVVHDCPTTRSAWFYRYNPENHDDALLWAQDDEEGEDEL